MCSIGKHPRPPACGGLREKNRGFRTLNDAVLRASLIPTSRLLRIITCHTSSLFYVTACHMTRCIVKTAAPILFGAVVSSCKASQIFYHILILRKASIMSPMCSGCGGRAFESHCSAPRERHDESALPIKNISSSAGTAWYENIMLFLFCYIPVRNQFYR